MSHSLSPHDHYLDNHEIALRISTLYPSAKFDQEHAMRAMDRLIIRYNNMANSASANQLKAQLVACRDAANYCSIFDSGGKVILSFLLVPNSNIIIGYDTVDQEERARVYVDAIAGVLDYRIIEL